MRKSSTRDLRLKSSCNRHKKATDTFTHSRHHADWNAERGNPACLYTFKIRRGMRTFCSKSANIIPKVKETRSDDDAGSLQAWLPQFSSISMYSILYIDDDRHHPYTCIRFLDPKMIHDPSGGLSTCFICKWHDTPLDTSFQPDLLHSV